MRNASPHQMLRRSTGARTLVFTSTLHVASSPPEARLGTGGVRTLIVEDQVLVARDIANALAKRGFELVGRATTAQDAIRLAGEAFPDLIIADVNLRGAIDGITAMEQIRRVRDAAIVYLTAYSDATTLERAVATNPCGFVVKPFSEASLHCAVEVALRRHTIEREARHLSMRDGPTGLYNRRAFMTLAEHQQKVARREGRRLAALFFDLDNLKRTNDELGHKEGDAAICAVATVLSKTLRGSDIVARLGGDEFAALLTGALGDGIETVLMRLGAALAEANRHAPPGYPLELSVGVAVAEPDDQSGIEDLIARADAAMYEEKRARKARRGDS